MSLRVWLVVLCSLGLLFGVGITQSVASVPDARIVVSDVSVEPTSPSADERVSVTFTLENSAGSASGVDIESVELASRARFGTTYGEAENLGSLSPGDEVTLDFPASFDEAGSYDLELRIDGSDEDGRTVTVTRPVPVDVGTAGPDIEVSAERVHMIETDDGVEVGGVEELLGASSDDEMEPTTAIEVQISNFGSATARDIYVRSSGESQNYTRLPVSDVSPNTSETVVFETKQFDTDELLTFEAAYRLSTDRPDSERRSAETTYEYRPGADSLVVTDMSIERDGNQLLLTGNAGNIGETELEGAVVAVGDGASVTPSSPQRDYFIGTIPDSDFVTFDLTATVDEGTTPETVPLNVQYRADGVQYERTIEVPYDEQAVDTDNGGSLFSSGIALSGLLVIGTGGYLWRRRQYARN